MKPSIWILTAVTSDYDQPDNDLVAWWHEKPSFAFLAEACGVGFTPDDDILNVIKLHQGEDRKMYPSCRGEALFTLRQVGEGVLYPDAKVEAAPTKLLEIRRAKT